MYAIGIILMLLRIPAISRNIFVYDGIQSQCISQVFAFSAVIKIVLDWWLLLSKYGGSTNPGIK